MSIDNSFFIKKIWKAKEILVLFSQVTRMPYIACDAQSFDDCVHVFLDEEQAKAYVKKRSEDKDFLFAVKMPGEQVRPFFVSLHALGVNAVKLFEGETSTILDLEKLAPVPDIDDLRKEDIPLYNPELQLSAIYFLQELRKPAEHDMKVLHDMEEEMVVNFGKSRFIIVMISAPAGEGEEEQIQLPYVKTKDGDIFQPIFTEVTEIGRHFKGKTEGVKMRAVEFQELPKFLMPEAKGFVINPSGFNLPLLREQFESLESSYLHAGEGEEPVPASLEDVIDAALQTQEVDDTPEHAGN